MEGKLQLGGVFTGAHAMFGRLTDDLARAVTTVDAKLPVAVNKRNGAKFDPGLGPHSETETFKLILEEARCADPSWLRELTYSVPYPSNLRQAGNKRQACDVRAVTADGTLYFEGKLLRLKGDNGKPNDNMLTHILSPYPQHRSALTDCLKLKNSGFEGRIGIIIVGYGYPDMPLEPAVEAFETLAKSRVQLGQRHEASFAGLSHRVHQQGKIIAWELE
jgi:hypothetical protein